jgi:hypothetical protein
LRPLIGKRCPVVMLILHSRYRKYYLYHRWVRWLGTAGACATGNSMSEKQSSTPRPYHFAASDEFWREIDDWRRVQPDLPSRAESIRRLVKKGLEADRKVTAHKRR